MSAPATERVPTGTAAHVSGLLPRAVLVLATALGVTAQVAGRDWPGGTPLPSLVPVLLAVVLAWRPALPLGALVVAGPAVLAVVAGGGLDVRDAVTLLAVHAAHVAAALGVVVPAHARLELRALRATWRRFLLVQAVSQGVLLAAVLLTGVLDR